MKYFWRTLAVLLLLVIGITFLPLAVIYSITAPFIFIVTGNFPEFGEDFLYGIYGKAMEYIDKKLIQY